MPPIVARRVGTFPTGSAAWHAARAGKMSGSRIAAAAGLSPYESAFSLWYRMAGFIGEQEVTEPMEWGNRLESAVIGKFADMHPEIHVIRKPGTWLNIARPWQLANPDALLRFPGVGGRRRADGVLEAKTAAYSDGWGTPGTDEIPIHYLCQVLWYLITLGLRWALVPVLIGGNDYREYVVDANAYADAIAELLDIGRHFLDTLEAGVAPDLDGHPATLTALKTLHPEIDGTSVDIPDAIGRNLVREKSRLVVPTARFNEAKAELVRFMGMAKTAYWDGIKIADRRSKQGGTPYLQLVSNLPVPTAVPAMPVPREKATV